MSALFQHAHDGSPTPPLLAIWYQVLQPDTEGPALIHRTVTDDAPLTRSIVFVTHRTAKPWHPGELALFVIHHSLYHKGKGDYQRHHPTGLPKGDGGRPR